MPTFETETPELTWGRFFLVTTAIVAVGAVFMTDAMVLPGNPNHDCLHWLAGPMGALPSKEAVCSETP